MKSELIKQIDFVLGEYGTGIAPEFDDIQALSNCLKDCRAELERLSKGNEALTNRLRVTEAALKRVAPNEVNLQSRAIKDEWRYRS